MTFSKLVFLIFILTIKIFSQDFGVPDPALPTNLPLSWKSTLADIDAEVALIKKGIVKTVATTPGGLPVYLVSFGEKEKLYSQANYNSAVAARNPAFYAKKDSTTKPVLFFLGPVHGQELENIVGLVNLIHVLETGVDYRGRAWPGLVEKAEQCRLLIIPCGNPDGRRRCPYDSFLGLPTKTMTKYGQGTRKDGSLYAWPGAKSVHPMTGDVGILGAYFNDDGINPMHDEFFAPMAEETRAILNVAREEAPDLAVSLHSHENKPVVLQASYVPMFMKKRISELSENVKGRYESVGLPYGGIIQPSVEDESFPPRQYFNLTSAIHHTSGALAFTFECSHGSISENMKEAVVDHEAILDVQLNLFDVMLEFALENRLLWE
jgi:hypothetical protein